MSGFQLILIASTSVVVALKSTFSQQRTTTNGIIPNNLTGPHGSSVYSLTDRFSTYTTKRMNVRYENSTAAHVDKEYENITAGHMDKDYCNTTAGRMGKGYDNTTTGNMDKEYCNTTKVQVHKGYGNTSEDPVDKGYGNTTAGHMSERYDSTTAGYADKGYHNTTEDQVDKGHGNTPEDHIDKEYDNTTVGQDGLKAALQRLLVLKVLTATMAVAYPITLIVNIIALNVLCKVKNNSGTEIIFIGLTIVDLLNTTSGASTNMLILLSYNYSHIGRLTLIKTAIKHLIWIDVGFHMSIFTISVTLSIERVFAVYKPMSFRKIWSRRFNSVTISIGSILTTGLFLSAGFLISENAFHTLRFVYAPLVLVVVIILNISTLIGLKTRTRTVSFYVSRKQKVNLIKMERRQTKILLGISVIFILCGLANCAVAFSAFFDHGDYDTASYNTFIIGYTRLIFQVVYSILNATIFVLTNRTYRHILKRMFCSTDNYSISSMDFGSNSNQSRDTVLSARTIHTI